MNSFVFFGIICDRNPDLFSMSHFFFYIVQVQQIFPELGDQNH